MNELQFTLGREYEGQDPLGWFVSEKLDGVRLFWDGEQFWTRGGFVVKSPAWFTAGLPACELDGELFAGRGNFEIARSAVHYGRWTDDCEFVVFDAPQVAGRWDARMRRAKAMLANAAHARVISFDVIVDRRDVFARLQKVHARNGEGLMLRSPHVTEYERGRTTNLLKLKGNHPALMLLQFHRTARHHRARRVARQTQT